jgi:hypothetical protein
MTKALIIFTCVIGSLAVQNARAATPKDSCGAIAAKSAIDFALGAGFYHCGSQPLQTTTETDGTYHIWLSCISENGSAAPHYSVAFENLKTCAGPSVIAIGPFN